MSEPTPGPRLLHVPADWTLPKLGKRVVPPGGGVGTDESSDIVTRYDTVAEDLAGLDISLERGSGTADGEPALWTLTIDGTSSRYPAVGRGVPVEIRDLLLGARAGGALRASGRAQVDRVTHRVRDDAGTELGTITEVEVRDPGTTGAVPRRHVEVAGWNGPFLDAVLARLSKFDAVERVRFHDDATDVEAGSVGAALLGFLQAQRREVVHADLGLRRDEQAVHSFRVAIRRTRSALRVVDIADTDRRLALDVELRWLSAVLGQVRDLQVLREHLAVSVTGLAPHTDVDLGPAEQALRDVLDTDEAAARAVLKATLAGRRYLTLLRTLRDWCDEPPFGGDAAEPEQRLARYVRDASKDLNKRLARAGGSASKLHGARKAAKRARYVASFAGESAGKHGGEIERRAKTLQTNLGDHQDSVLAADFVRRAAGVLGRASGDAAFGCGVLWAYEQNRADAALRAAEKAQHD